MRDWSRRQFLRWLAIQTGAVVGIKLISACSESTALPPNPIIPTETYISADGSDTPSSLDTVTAIPEAQPSPTQESSVYPDLVVARGGEPGVLVRAAINAIGGIERFVPAGSDVIVKPNICVSYHSYEYAATTNPWVVGELVQMCIQAGAERVRVLDFPFGGTSEEAYARSGIEEQVYAAGGIMEPIAPFKFVRTEIPYAMELMECDIYDDVLQADVVINVPIAKHHSLAKLTLGMKNLMGVIRDRPSMHRNLGKRLADLASKIRPALTVVDAVRVLRANGPAGGSLADVEKLDTVISSPDIVAADSYAATLFNMSPADLAYIQGGILMGLGRSDLENMRIEELQAGG